MYRPTDQEPNLPKPDQDKTIFELIMGMTAEEWDAVVMAERDLDNE